MRWIVCVMMGSVALAALAVGSAAQPAGEGQDVEATTSSVPPVTDDPSQRSYYMDQLRSVPDAGRLRAWHDMVASDPHDAGTPGDHALIAKLAETFASFGLEVETQWLEVYIAEPRAAVVEVVAGSGVGDEPIELSLRERAIEGDAFSGRRTLRMGWNAYSGSGDVTAPVIYANYGRPEDFARLAEAGVDVEGAVVLMRYGRNYRGVKARLAEAAGAAAVILYTDPGDSGGSDADDRWPAGGFANETSIQRGSIKDIPYAGDPLTPGVAATADAERLDPAEVGLPTIPVQPIGWAAAEQILERMDGEAVPEAWRGGLDLAYRLGGEGDLRVRVMVEQRRGLTRTANVIARLEGWDDPDAEVIIGCHHDAWGYGAGDPGAGTMCLIETARAFGELAKQGIRPRRSVVFAAWGAEEHGIIGSTEYVESRLSTIEQNAVAYINLDMAAMGPNFRAAATPSLRDAIEAAASRVPDAGDPNRTVLAAWLERSEDDARPGSPAFGDLGGGSDHLPFMCHACVPSAGFSAGGSRGVSYHTIYDDLDWYRAVVGDDYASALMITRMTAATAGALADLAVLPTDPGAYGLRGGAAIAASRLDAQQAGMLGRPPVGPALQRAYTDAQTAAGNAADATRRLIEYARVIEQYGVPTPADLRTFAAEMRMMERVWCDAVETDQPFFRNGFAGPDAESGYGALVFPSLVEAVRDRDAEGAIARLGEISAAYRAIAERARAELHRLEAVREAHRDARRGANP